MPLSSVYFPLKNEPKNITNMLMFIILISMFEINQVLDGKKIYFQTWRRSCFTDFLSIFFIYLFIYLFIRDFLIFFLFPLISKGDQLYFKKKIWHIIFLLGIKLFIDFEWVEENFRLNIQIWHQAGGLQKMCQV
jgi:hypothetical protein